MVPTECFGNDYGGPIIQFKVKKGRQTIGFEYYAEYYHKPILLKEADYRKNQDLTIEVKYKWYESPARDYTVKVYSQMEVPVKDSRGR